MSRPLSISVFGDAQVDTAVKQFGTGSLQLDGAGDYIQVNDPNETFNFGTNDFTIEFWYKKDDTNVTSRLASNRGAYSVGHWYIQFDHTTDKIQWGVNGAAAQRTSSTFDDTNWHHIALTRNSGDFTLWVDGVSESTLNGTTHVFGRTSDKYIKFGAISSLTQGAKHIDEMRVSNICRYTTSFTPSTSAFTDDADTLVLIHADGADGSTTFTDDYDVGGETVTMSPATFSSAATVTTTASRIREGAASISGAMTANISITVSKNGSIDVSTAVTMSTDADRTRSSSVTLDTIINLSLQGDKILSGASALDSAATANITADRTRITSSSLAVSFEQTTTATRIQSGAATLDGAFNATMTAVASLNGSIDVLSSATLAVDPGKIHPGSATLASAFAQSVNGGPLIEADAATYSSASTFTASAISYATPDFTQPWRPLTMDGSIDTTVYKYGTGSLRLTGISEVNTEVRTDGTTFPIDSGEEFVIEFWHRAQGYSASERSMFQLGFSSFQDWQDYDGTTFNGNLLISGYDTSQKPKLVVVTPDSNTNLTLSPNITLSDNTWYHHRITRDSGGTIRYRVGGAIASASYSGSFEFAGGSDKNLFLNGAAPTGFDYYDGFAMRVGDDTITGTSSQPTNDDAYQIFNFSFDGSTTEILENTKKYADATLSSAFTQIANGGTTALFSANLNSAATLNADVDKVVFSDIGELSSASTLSAEIGKLQTADSSLNATFTQTSDFDRFRSTAISLNSVFAQNLTVIRIVGVDSTLNSVASIESQITRIKPLAADFDSIVTQVTAVVRIAGLLIEPDTRFTQTADINATFDTGANIDALAQISIDGQRVRTTTASFNSASNFAIEFTVIEPGGATLNSEFAQTATATRIQPGAATLNSEFTLAAEGEKGLELNELIAGEFTQTVDADRTRESGYANYQGVFSQVTDTRKIVPGAATLASAGGFVLNAAATRVGEIALDNTTTLAAAINVIRQGASEISANTTQNVTVGSILQFDSNLTSASSLAIAAGLQASASAALASAFTISASGATPRLDQYVYIIPRESRLFTIDSETRAHTVHRETRNYTIPE